ncbi:MAG: hypothetical protein WBD74_09715 [Candidatus Aquilonibacter sp.]
MPTALKTIITVRSTQLCTATADTVLYTITGLQANDRLIESSKPLLLEMGRDFIPVSEVGSAFGKRTSRFGGAHDPSAALLLDNQHLIKLADEIVHNLAIIDSLLNDRSRFPIVAKTDADKEALLLKAQLQAVSDQQRKILNILYGLSDTFSLQALVAKGDGMQGATGSGGSGAQVGQGDQDVSFRDVLSASARGRSGPADPTVDQDPAVSQPPTELSNSPIARFYVGVAEQQRSTASAENALTQTVLSVAATCRQ